MILAPRVKWDRRGHKVRKGKWGRRGNKAHKGMWVRRESKGHQDHKVNAANRDFLGCLG